MTQRTVDGYVVVRPSVAGGMEVMGLGLSEQAALACCCHSTLHGVAKPEELHQTHPNLRVLPARFVATFDVPETAPNQPSLLP